MKKFYRTSAFAAMELTPLLLEVLVGTMLGDCSAQKNGPKSNARLQFKQSVVNQPYIDHLYDLFKDYTGSKPLWHTQHDPRPNRSPFAHSCTFKTRSLACFTKVYDLFYSDGIKILPSNLGDLLTARGVAYWFMDDGYNGPKSSMGLFFCTECFTLKECELLMSILTDKFGLNCGMIKYNGNHRIYVRNSSREDFINLVRPYLLPHFYYKVGLAHP
jgi:hypothetical protein